MDRLIDDMIDFRFDADLVIARPAVVRPAHVWLTLAVALFVLVIDSIGCSSASRDAVGVAQSVGSL